MKLYISLHVYRKQQKKNLSKHMKIYCHVTILFLKEFWKPYWFLLCKNKN